MGRPMVLVPAAAGLLGVAMFALTLPDPTDDGGSWSDLSHTALRRLGGGGGGVKLDPSEAKVVAMICVTVIILLVVVFEHGHHHLVHVTPDPMQPILESMMTELTVLGFIGMVSFVLDISGAIKYLAHLVSDEVDYAPSVLHEFHLWHYWLFIIMVFLIFFVTVAYWYGSRSIKKWYVYEHLEMDEEVAKLRAEVRKDGFTARSWLRSVLAGPGCCSYLACRCCTGARTSQRHLVRRIKTVRGMSWRKAIIDERAQKPAGLTDTDWRVHFNSDTVPRARAWMRDHGSGEGTPATYRNFPFARYMHHCYGHMVSRMIKLGAFDWFAVLAIFLVMKATALLLYTHTDETFHKAFPPAGLILLYLCLFYLVSLQREISTALAQLHPHGDLYKAFFDNDKGETDRASQAQFCLALGADLGFSSDQVGELVDWDHSLPIYLLRKSTIKQDGVNRHQHLMWERHTRCVSCASGSVKDRYLFELRQILILVMMEFGDILIATFKVSLDNDLATAATIGHGVFTWPNIWLALTIIPVLFITSSIVRTLVDLTFIFSNEQYFNNRIARRVLGLTRRRKLVTMMKLIGLLAAPDHGHGHDGHGHDDHGHDDHGHDDHGHDSHGGTSKHSGGRVPDAAVIDHVDEEKGEGGPAPEKAAASPAPHQRTVVSLYRTETDESVRVAHTEETKGAATEHADHHLQGALAKAGMKHTALVHGELKKGERLSRLEDVQIRDVIIATYDAIEGQAHGDDGIGYKDFVRLFKEMHMKLSEEEVRELFNRLDHAAEGNSDGLISRSDFYKVAGSLLSELKHAREDDHHNHHVAHTVFSVFMDPHTHKISSSALAQVLTTLSSTGDYLSQTECNAIVDEADHDGSGDITAHEFHHLLEHYHLSSYA